MSIASRITAMEGHIEDTYDMLEVGGADLTNVDKNLNNMSSIIKERYLDYMNNGTDEIWNNWDKTTQNNVTEPTLNNTIEAPMKIDLKGNTSQNGTATPDNPQDIHVVTGDCSVKKLGKNLFDNNYYINHIEDFSDVYVNYFYAIELGEEFKTVLTASTTLKGTITPTYVLSLLNEARKPESNERFLTTDGAVGFKTYDFTNSEHVYLIIGRSTPISSTSVLLEVLNTILANYDIQIEKSSTKTNYKPYQSQTFPLTLGTIELCKIGDYQDKIYKDNGKWYLYKAVGKTIINGSETINVEDGRYQISVHLNAPSNTNWHIVLLLSNYFKGSSLNGLKNANNQITYHPYNLVPAIYSTDFANATELSNFLTQKYNNNEPLYMFYALATPTTTEITDGTLIYQLEALENAKSYSNITNITQSNADLPFILDVSALTELSS